MDEYNISKGKVALTVIVVISLAIFAGVILHKQVDRDLDNVTNSYDKMKAQKNKENKEKLQSESNHQ